MCNIVCIKILFAWDSTSFVSKQTTELAESIWAAKKGLVILNYLENIPVSPYFTMCLPKNHHIVVLLAILIFVFKTEASPVGNLDPIETALVENCLKNCEICENNFIDFLEGEFCRDTCVKGRGLIQKVHCNANGLSATIAPGMVEVLKILGDK